MKLLLFTICLLLILPVSSLNQGQTSCLSELTFRDNTKNQTFKLNNFNSTYILLIFFDYDYEEWILTNGSLIYSCFNHSELEFVTVFVDKDNDFTDLSLAEIHWDYKCALYNIIPEWYFGYINNRSLIITLDSSFILSGFVVFLLDGKDLSTKFMTTGLNFMELWNEVTKYVEPTSIPKELEHYLKNPKKAIGFVFIGILICMISLVFLRKKKNAI